MLKLEYYADMSEKDIREDICSQYAITREELDKYDLLVVWNSEPDYEESSWFLLRERSSGKLFENSGGHCSCYGYEGQFEPGLSSKEYILSDKFYGPYGYHTEQVQKYVKRYVR